ncbi:MAG: hypothetical protein J6A01_12790 [Proteobacteria bacterium]|nr:hypothetical protein [Pseudomonadota bacterium]
MNLNQFDGKCVRITDIHGDVFDGICSYNNADYDEHEFGIFEESLQIVYVIFYRSDIQSVESLEDHTGPYGKFLDPYGKLEEMAAQDGIESITEMLFCEENVHVIRMLNCLDKYLDPYYGCKFTCRSETIDALEALCDSTSDKEIKEEAERLIEMWK